MTKTKTIIIFLIAFFGVLVFSKSSLAATYYVDNTCPNNGNGQGQSCAISADGVGPFNSLANAQSAVTGNQSDNSLLFKRGQTFSGQFTVGAYGTEGNPFTIGAYGTGANPIVNGGSNNILIYDKSWIVVDGLVFNKPQGAWQACVMVQGTSSHITVRNCEMIGDEVNSYYGIRGVGATNNYITVANNVIHGFIRYGIFLNGTNSLPSVRSVGHIVYGNDSYGNTGGAYFILVDDSYIYQNNFHDNSFRIEGQGEEYGIGILACSNNEWYENRVYNNNNMGIQFYGGNPVPDGDHPAGDFGPCIGNKVYRNSIYNNTNGNGHGLAFSNGPNSGDYCYNNEVYCNIIKGNTNGLVTYFSKDQPNLFYNNTVYRNTIGFLASTFARPYCGVTLKNNLFTENTNYDIDANTASTLTHNNNLYYRDAGGNRVRFNGTTYNATTIKTFETSCQNTDPKLVSTSDFHLLSDSPSINAGVDVGLTQDYEGNPIIGLPDIGAYEYVSGVPDTTLPAPPSGVKVS